MSAFFYGMAASCAGFAFVFYWIGRWRESAFALKQAEAAREETTRLAQERSLLSLWEEVESLWKRVESLSGDKEKP